MPREYEGASECQDEDAEVTGLLILRSIDSDPEEPPFVIRTWCRRRSGRDGLGSDEVGRQSATPLQPLDIEELGGVEALSPREVR